ncbi:PREDICTED: trem-like transcript 1 protein isoform X1 [Chinchilla lanigera]|uniref:trem-like transcript 1 protein isoform X1 n=1 Tax=Chinchilla lanigera TaxID=34839 RepID=UPI00038EEB49|nr:PREDICTED: trem-like transcript 1 protein isoform X1 [Chinchilla lanigera]
MGPSLLLLLLLLLGLEGWGSAGSRPEVLQVPVGGSIQVQCHYRLQDIRARKVWCRFSPEGCQPLVTSAVDRSAPGNRRTFLTDMGGGLLQVEMVTLQEADAGEYGCLVEGALGPHLVHTFALEVLPTVPGLTEGEEEEEETFGIGTLAEDHFSDPKGSASPWELSQHENSVPLVWGAVLLLGLLAVAVALLVVVAKRKGNRLGARGQFQSSRVSDLDPSSAAHHAGDSGLAAASPWDVPYVRLDSPPSFDTTYTNLALEPLSGKAPAPPPPPPLPPKVVQSPKPVTYATVVFLGGDKGGGASSELPRDPPSSPSPLS